MSKSLDFCKTRASDSKVSSYADRNWDAAYEQETSEFINIMLGTIRKYKLKEVLDDGTEVQYNITVEVNPEADFDFFISKSYLSDGTAYFLFNSMEELLLRILYMRTYNKALGEPKNGFNIRWIIGNFVYLNEYNGDWVPEDKKWMCERTTILLPVRCIYE